MLAECNCDDMRRQRRSSASQPPRTVARHGISDIPAGPICNTPKTPRPGFRFAAKCGLNASPPPRVGTSRPNANVTHLRPPAHAFPGASPRRAARGAIFQPWPPTRRTIRGAGNLPRSRPGHRSDKRGGAAPDSAKASATGSPAKPTRAAAKASGTKSRTAKRSTATSGTSGSRAAAGARSARAKPAASTRTRKAPARPPAQTDAPARPAPPRRPVPQEGPLTGAVRLAGKVADAGLKTAGGLLRKLPGR